LKNLSNTHLAHPSAGMASIEHLQILLNDTKTHDEYAHLWNETTNSWVERPDVYAKFDDHVGKLTVGFGATGKFGTELEFGWYVKFHFARVCVDRRDVSYQMYHFSHYNLRFFRFQTTQGPGRCPVRLSKTNITLKDCLWG
jgi:hypothetical protein